MISFFNRHPLLSRSALETALLCARLLGVPSTIVTRTRSIYQERQFEFALGFITWFIMFRLHLPLPAYNIYHLVADEQKDQVHALLATRPDDFRVSKQYHLLQSEDLIDHSFIQSIEKYLSSRMQHTVKKSSTNVRQFDTSKAMESLRAIDSTLRGYGLEPFLVSGTLLGCIRDNRLVEGDKDLDIGIMEATATAEHIFALLSQDKTLVSVYNLGHLVQVTDRNNIVIDIFIHYRENDTIWHGSDVHKWVNTGFGLAEREFQGQRFFTPDNPERYLDENYGNWKNPVLFWDYSFDTPNRDFFPNRKSVYFLAERILNELDKERPGRYPVQTAIEELHSRFGIDLSHYLGTAQARTSEVSHGTDEQPKTVITFGTFDLFHIGHLNILRRAAALGDRLVVGVSSDALNINKKDISPVYSQQDRLSIVASIAGVDEVFFEESLELKRDYIIEHKADVLVMGADWGGKFDYLADICEVVYLPRTDNISTSETKDSIKRNL